ncbi:regulatory protein GemA [Caballeronia sp. LZ001]|uniref:gp16 family protein n=1 Tax=Caballeronia sp. LZ001 TaxID=3038553 RepID=UPI00285886C0|nr:regulatory protein GemA [Caballeronia sp. LZ001]MDR5803423.1 regulatory protein GemA [Caballeronia sp. LZ001]
MITQQMLAKIHIGKRQLGLDDDTYRAMLRSVASVDSARELDVIGAENVLRHMRRCGFVATSKHGRRPRVALPREAQLRKVEALLTHSGRSWRYAEGMVKRICKVDAIEFCDAEMLRKLIAALQLDANRRAK